MGRKNKRRHVAKARQQKAARPYWVVKLRDKLGLTRSMPSK